MSHTIRDKQKLKAVNGLMREVIKGHLTEHIVHQGDELKREEDLDVVLKVLDSYIK